MKKEYRYDYERAFALVAHVITAYVKTALLIFFTNDHIGLDYCFCSLDDETTKYYHIFPILLQEEPDGVLASAPRWDLRPVRSPTLPPAPSLAGLSGSSMESLCHRIPQRHSSKDKMSQFSLPLPRILGGCDSLDACGKTRPRSSVTIGYNQSGQKLQTKKRSVLSPNAHEAIKISKRDKKNSRIPTMSSTFFVK